MQQSGKQRKSRWPGMLHMADNQVNEECNKEEEVDFPLAVGSFMRSHHRLEQEEDSQYPVPQQPKAIRQVRVHRATGQMYNAGTAVVTVILRINVHLHHDRAEEEAVVDGTIADDEEVVVEDEGDVEVPKDQLMPHWCRRNQWGLDLNCNRHRFHPQCPVLTKDRETSCALPWPA